MITTIIFDWGGVLTVGRHSTSIIRLLEERYKIRIENTNREFSSLIDLIDSDSISFSEFVRMVNDRYEISVSVEEMRQVFGKAITPNKQVTALVERLGKNYRLVLLSNNNKPTIGFLRNSLKHMIAPFEKTYFSCELKLIKPDKAFFEHILKDLGVDPKECLFVDDHKRNTRIAEQLGIRSIVFESSEQLGRALDSLLIKTS